MTAPLEYEFKVIGRAVVEREIAALERRFIQSANKLNKEFNKLGSGTGGSNRTGSLGGLAGSATRFRDPVFGPGRKEQMAQIRANERAAVNAVRAERRQVESLNRSRQSLHNQRIREERTTRGEITKSDREKQRAIDRQSSSQQALAKQRIREEREALNVAKSRADFVRSTVGAGVGRVTGAIASVGRVGLSVAGLSAAGLAASSISQAITLDEGARRLSIAGRDPGERGVDHKMMIRDFMKTGIATGIAPESLMAGAREYVAKTGDIGSALRNQKTYATLAQGEDTNIKDVFAMAAAMKNGLGLNDDEVKKASAIWTMQGKKGRFELNNFATEGPEILTTAAAAGMRGVEGAKTIGALAQIGMMGNGSPAEASTSLRNMIFDVAANADKIQSGAKFGKKVKVYNDWDEKKGMRSDFDNLLIESISATRGSLGDMGEVFKRRGIKTPLTLMKTYQDAYQGTKGSDKEKDVAATAAVKSQVDYFKNLPADFSTVEQDSADAMKSFAVRMEIINTKLKDAIASQLFPEIVKLIPEIEKLIPYVADATKAFIDLVKYLSDNPLKGLSYAIAASVAFEFAKAGIGKIVTSSLTSLFLTASGAGGVGIGGAGTSLPGTVIAGSAAKVSPMARIGGAVIGGVAGYAGGTALAAAVGGDSRDQEQAGAVGAGFGAGLLSLGPAAAAAGAALGLMADQAHALVREGGGLDFWNYDENLNKEAKKRSGRYNDDGTLTDEAVKSDQDAYTAKFAANQAAEAATAATLAYQKEVAAFTEALKVAGGVVNGIIKTPNSGDKPSPIKNPK